MFPWSGWYLALNTAVILWAGWHLVRRPKGKAAEEARKREWSSDDLIACVLSALAYFNGLAGTALVLINNLTGWLLVIATALEILLMFRVIDPKLKTVSGSFELKQQEYLEELDRIVEWERDTSPGEQGA